MNEITSKYVILCSSILGIFTSLYIMRYRRKNKLYSLKDSFLIFSNSNNNSSNSNNFNNSSNYNNYNNSNNELNLLLQNDKKENESYDKNVGFGTDPTWTKKNRPDKKDLLHTGSKGGKLLIVLVGLPGSGKTFIARKVSRFLRWISYRTRVFSVATYRLEKLGAKNADFFNPENKKNVQKRNEVFLLALEDAMRYLKKDGEIAILDGSNSTTYRRELIRNRVSKEDGFGILWIEKILSIDEIVSSHLASVKLSPDFSSEDDFRQRILHYQNNYDTVREEEGSYIKLIGTSVDNIHLHGITGFLRTKISSFVMNIHTSPRTIYLVRAGESEYIARGLIGGDSGLTPEGIEFAKSLGEFFINDKSGFSNVTSSQGLVVWSSTMKSALQTAEYIKTKIRTVEWRALREIESGVCDGLTYDQIKVRYPKEYQARQQDKLTYRYPRGESYFDVITRLEPLIFEMERATHPLLIIGHLAVLRCVLAYLLDIPVEEVPFRKIEMNTLIRLDPQAYGCKERSILITGNNSVEEEEDEGLKIE